MPPPSNTNHQRYLPLASSWAVGQLMVSALSINVEFKLATYYGTVLGKLLGISESQNFL